MVECNLDELQVSNPESMTSWNMDTISTLCAPDTTAIPSGMEQPAPVVTKADRVWPPTVPYPHQVADDDDDIDDEDEYDPADPSFATTFSVRWKGWLEHPLICVAARICRPAYHAGIFNQIQIELEGVISGTARDKLTCLWPALRQEMMAIDTMIAKPVKEEKAKWAKWETAKTRILALFDIMRQARKDKDAADAKEAAHAESLAAAALVTSQMAEATAELDEDEPPKPRKPFYCYVSAVVVVHFLTFVCSKAISFYATGGTALGHVPGPLRR